MRKKWLLPLVALAIVLAAILIPLLPSSASDVAAAGPAPKEKKGPSVFWD